MSREESGDPFGEAVAAVLSDEQIELLKRLHEEISNCAANGEGMACCVDWIVNARRSA